MKKPALGLLSLNTFNQGNVFLQQVIDYHVQLNAEVASHYTGGLSDFLSVRRMGTKVGKFAVKKLAKSVRKANDEIAEGVTKRVETPHTVNTGGKAPKTSEPNSIIESQRADGSSSVTYYDDKGRAFSREDYGQQSTHGSLGQRSDGRSVAHEHRFDYNDRGYPIKQDVYRELSETGTPVGPWIQNR